MLAWNEERMGAVRKIIAAQLRIEVAYGFKGCLGCVSDDFYMDWFRTREGHLLDIQGAVIF